MFSIFRRQKACPDIVMCRRMIIVVQTVMLELKKDGRYVPTEVDLSDLDHIGELTQQLLCLILCARRCISERIEN